MLTLRNLLVAVLLVWAIVRLARVPGRITAGRGTAALDRSASTIGS